MELKTERYASPKAVVSPGTEDEGKGNVMRTLAAILSFALFCNVLPAAEPNSASRGRETPDQRTEWPNEPFTHPGILHRRVELGFVKTQVAQGKEPWKSAWQELRSHDTSQLDWKPKPIADVVRGVRNNPDIGGTNLMHAG